MPRAERLDLIRQLQTERNSSVVTYFCGDRKPLGAQIAEDLLRPMYDQLLRISPVGKVARLDFFLYSTGGAMETPWKVVTMLRQFCDELNVIVPFKAYSAATLIALGADKIWMTRKGELGPIDPAMTLRSVPNPEKIPAAILGEIGVEDVAAYVSFIRNRAGLTDQAALAGVVGTLAETLTPTLLGRLERTYSHIRLVARKLLSLVQPPLDDTTVTTIVEALTEKSYAHGHGIGRQEARQLGLKVFDLDQAQDDLVWRLYLDYEASLRLGDSGDVSVKFTDNGPDNVREDNYEVAYIESEQLQHSFSGGLDLRRVRRVPQQLSLNLNFNLQLPAGVQPAQLPANVQQVTQQILQQVSTEAERLVREELRKQAPVERTEINLRDGQWRVAN